VRARVERFTEPAILLLLRARPKHGYQLLEELPELSFESAQADLGNLYRMLRALEHEGLVRSAWQTEPGPPRRVYELTSEGVELLDSWAESLRETRSTIDRFLSLYDAKRGR
jgi:PadR family transcriptional regulator PadR